MIYLLVVLLAATILQLVHNFEAYAKILWFVALISPLSLIGITAAILLKTKENDLYLKIFFNSLTLITLSLSLIFFNLRNKYEINVLFLPVIVILILFVVSFVMISYRDKKAYQSELEVESLKLQVEQSNASILLSQIRPHFLYNTLNAIVFLCRTNPKDAEDAIITFSKYLRANMNSLEKKDSIPFEDELNHIRNYVKIEQLRFGKKLKTQYDIQYTDFTIPPLTVQPLVENAIKHGITKKADGGILTLKTYDDDENIYIIIEDTGVGFDVKETMEHYKSTSIGLNNISKRLKILSNGVIKFESEIGKGTKASITMPKKDNKKPIINPINKLKD